ncbi:SDR family NAD(P)-dependent oxidoreductase [Thalassotalea mangrovi]|uniref:SDR family NAD(P)-dependent oxidoreductase n=1 Tax=Thalassotalea mangrovi TaxID=2572245 RepID=A0A4U1B5P1_9GAMM|nr:SDR family NAD(P)-dependent oxidoreductase [Thalassotalea mangrovi]TKB45738.1 SDR family NAD(P)-dependent oxidoreductase [Thalassotalea mangrovi]
MHPYQNKVVVVTGGSGGIGQELCKQLLAQEALVACLDLNTDSAVQHDNALNLALDITDYEQLVDAVAQIKSRFGRIDVLINNAGITHMSRFTDSGKDLADRILAVNYTAAVDITRLCLDEIIRNQGHIIAMSSVAGFAPLYGRSIYAGSKHAMQGFFYSLASELKEQGVGVSVICPSFVRSRPELTAQVNAGVSSPGALKKNTNGEQISPQLAAKRILAAGIKGQRTVYLGKVANIARWLFALLPSVYLNVMSKGAKQEFE